MSARVSGFILDNYPWGGSEKLVALALADEANSDGDHIFPGVPRLARRCCMTERGVQKILRRIESRETAGVFWFERVKASRGGYKQTNHYRCPIAALETAVRETVNDVQGYQSETANDVQGNACETVNAVRGNNGEHCSGLEPKPRTQVHKTPNGGSPNPLYPPYRASRACTPRQERPPAREAGPAEADDPNRVPATVNEWGTHLAQRYGYSLSEVMSVPVMAMVRDWVSRQLPVGLVDAAIESAHTKNGGRPGSPAYYRNFVNQMVAAEQAAADNVQPLSRDGGSHGQNHSGNGRRKTNTEAFFDDILEAY